MSVAAPSITLLILDLFPAIRGVVASSQSFVQTMLGAIVAGVIVPVLDASVLRLALGQLAFTLIGLAFWKGSLSYHRRVHSHDEDQAAG
jgi:DHA1 family bicyclomycin/chloramphenicol resistance-like MFS transporter